MRFRSHVISRSEVVLQSNDFASVSFLDRRRSFLLKSSFDQFLFKSLSSLSLKLFLLFWLLKFCDENKAIKAVALELFLDDLNIWYKKSISHESFDKLRKLSQSIWCFWFVVIVMNSSKLEMIDACRWRHQRNRMIEISYVDSLYWDDLHSQLCSEVFSFFKLELAL